MAAVLDQVMQMKQQGLSDNQIIQTLQRAGNNPQEIFDAMSQADIKGGVQGAMPAQDMNMQMPENPMQMQAPQQDMGMQQQMYQQPQGGVSNEEVEAIAESIIDEKWDDLMKSMSKVVAWKEELDNKLAEMDQKFADLQKNYEELHKSVLGKIGDYDKTMTDVGTDLKAMSSVFKKILPGFMETVGELGSIRDDLAGSTGKKIVRKEREEEPLFEEMTKPAPKPSAKQRFSNNSEEESEDSEEKPAAKKRSIEEKF